MKAVVVTPSEENGGERQSSCPERCLELFEGIVSP